jgi:hypothetical protein
MLCVESKRLVSYSCARGTPWEGRWESRSNITLDLQVGAHPPEPTARDREGRGGCNKRTYKREMETTEVVGFETGAACDVLRLRLVGCLAVSGVPRPCGLKPTLKVGGGRRETESVMVASVP